jgi:hypothetical protein
VGRNAELAKSRRREPGEARAGSNHVHLVVRTRPEVVSGWSDEEVARRWLRLCPGRKDPLAVAREEEVRLEVLLKDVEKLKVCRERLGT